VSMVSCMVATCYINLQMKSNVILLYRRDTTNGVNPEGLSDVQLIWRYGRSHYEEYIVLDIAHKSVDLEYYWNENASCITYEFRTLLMYK